MLFINTGCDFGLSITDAATLCLKSPKGAPSRHEWTKVLGLPSPPGPPCLQQPQSVAQGFTKGHSSSGSRHVICHLDHQDGLISIYLPVLGVFALTSRRYNF